MEDAIDKDKPIDKNKEKGKLEFIILHRNQCKDYLEKADRAISDLTRMASSRLLLCGVGVGKLDQHFFYFWDVQYRL